MESSLYIVPPSSPNSSGSVLISAPVSDSYTVASSPSGTATVTTAGSIYAPPFTPLQFQPTFAPDVGVNSAQRVSGFGTAMLTTCVTDPTAAASTASASASPCLLLAGLQNRNLPRLVLQARAGLIQNSALNFSVMSHYGDAPMLSTYVYSAVPMTVPVVNATRSWISLTYIDAQVGSLRVGWYLSACVGLVLVGLCRVLVAG